MAVNGFTEALTACFLLPRLVSRMLELMQISVAMKLGKMLVFCLLLMFLPITYTNLEDIGNNRPCGQDNLSCPGGVTERQTNPSPICLNASQLCDGVSDCRDGPDEGINFPSLNCKCDSSYACGTKLICEKLAPPTLCLGLAIWYTA